MWSGCCGSCWVEALLLSPVVDMSWDSAPLRFASAPDIVTMDFNSTFSFDSRIAIRTLNYIDFKCLRYTGGIKARKYQWCSCFLISLSLYI